MANVCIITDNLIQHSSIRFPGQKRIRLLHIHPCLSGKIKEDASNELVAKLPLSANDDLNPHLVAPHSDEIRAAFNALLDVYDEIVGIFSSSALSATYKNAVRAAEQLNTESRIQVIDSQTLSVGLGHLVTRAAILAEEGASAAEIVQVIYSRLPHIYTLFCTPSLSYLYYNHLLDRSQAFVGEKLGLLPNFTIEDGMFSAIDKMRNRRHVTDYYLDFINEFVHLEHIAYLQGANSQNVTAKIIREHVKESYPDTSFSEHRLTLTVASLFGPKCVGMIILDNE